MKSYGGNYSGLGSIFHSRDVHSAGQCRYVLRENIRPSTDENLCACLCIISHCQLSMQSHAYHVVHTFADGLLDM